MKTSKIIIASLLVTSLGVGIQSNSALQASTTNTLDSQKQIVLPVQLKPTELQIDKNNVLEFESIHDKERYIKQYGIKDIEDLQSNTSSNTSVRSLTYINGQPAQLYSNKNHSKVFGGWMSPAWAYHTSYSYKAGTKYGFSATVDGVGVTNDFTFESGGTIGVDYPKKLSKLGKFADINIKKYYVYATVGDTYKVSKKKITNRYFLVRYKK